MMLGLVRLDSLYSPDLVTDMQCNDLFPKQYKTKKGIVLARAGLVVIRAIAKKHGWVTSHVYTSK